MKLTNILKSILNEQMGADASILVYRVMFETSKYNEIIYEGIDKTKAIKSFEGFDDIPDYWDNNMHLVVESYIHYYKFTEDDMNDFPIDDYYNDDSVYKLINIGEGEIIHSRKIHPKNKDSDMLLDDIQDYFKNLYGNRKYNKIMVGGKCIQLRIADHTENIMNVDRHGDCDYYISVVIANLDKTIGRFGVQNKMERRRNEYELRYNSMDDFDDIIMEISNLIDSLK